MIEPGKLKALVDEHNKNPISGLPKEMKDSSSDDSSDGGEPQNPLDAMGDFGQTLRDNADVLVGIADEIDEPLGQDEPSGAVSEMIIESISRMPQEMVAGMVENIKPMNYDQVMAVCDALQKEGTIDDAGLLGGWLYWASHLAQENPETPEEEDMENEDYSDESSEDDGDQSQN